MRIFETVECEKIRFEDTLVSNGQSQNASYFLVKSRLELP